ncbi:MULTISPECIES: glycosyltransferase [Protofrankia]|uniref:Glycosyl transferase n=1 Tax=Protofrankia coriariae TaxID=1562887 RepID=A0ABR5F0C9_9ACTN|nr:MULTISPECIES: cellulose synthase catalytic subunit [Protofrankia]KLL10155.1 glycosyl transferase [Protofrankia coriariae]ONH37499.1 glycosyl transferase [Protofrankia sp. BMG5.30]
MARDTAPSGAAAPVDGDLVPLVPRPRQPAEVPPRARPATAAGGTGAAAVSGRTGRVAGLLVIALGAIYLAWRTATLGGTSAIGYLFYAAELVAYLAVGWTAVMMGRLRPGAARQAPPPVGTLDVFVTVCGEPAAMVERTLRFALAIDYPHQTYVLNDGRIAGRKDWREIDALASRLGVPCFTRVDGTPGKAGNLNHALARTRGDAVLALDADHLVVPDLGEQVVGYLRDPDVGFVCTAQRFDTGRLDVLNNADSIFYRSLQPAKERDNAAVSCGNGTLYRRSALESVGGFSEWNIVEDVQTSYELHAHGWSSVYHPVPISIGTAPATAAVYAKQRLRWAMDSTRLLLFDNPLAKPGLTRWQRAHYLHSTLSPLLASVQVVFALGPVLSIVFRSQLASTGSQRAYLLFGLPYFASTLFFIAAYAGTRAAPRTVSSVLFNSPIYLLALARVASGYRPRSSGTTEKAFQPKVSLLMLPQVLLAAVLVFSVVFYAFDTRADRPVEALAWAGILLVTLAGPLSSVSERRAAVERWQAPIRGAIILAVAFLSAWTFAH